MAVIPLASDEEMFIKQLTNDPKNLIVIASASGGIGETIVGFVDVDLGFGASSTYNAELISGMAQDADPSQGIGDMTGSHIRANSVKLSRQSWQVSQFQAVTFDLFIVATQESDSNPLDEGKKIFDYLLPDTYVVPGFMTTPNHYEVSAFGQSGAVDVSVGQWFRSVDQAFVMTAGNMDVSKAKQPDGIAPLYVKLSITLTPSRNFFASEVKSFFGTFG